MKRKTVDSLIAAAPVTMNRQGIYHIDPSFKHELEAILRDIIGTVDPNANTLKMTEQQAGCYQTKLNQIERAKDWGFDLSKESV